MRLKIFTILILAIGCTSNNGLLEENNGILTENIKKQTEEIRKQTARIGNPSWAMELINKSDSLTKYLEIQIAKETDNEIINKLLIEQLTNQHNVYKELLSKLYKVDIVEPILIKENDTVIVSVKSGLSGLIPFFEIKSDNDNLQIDFETPMDGKIPSKYLEGDKYQVILHSPNNNVEESWDLKKYTH